MQFPTIKSNKTEKCHVCNQVIPIYNFSEHYAICHILWSNPKNIPAYSYDDGNEIYNYSFEQNKLINNALINKQRQVKISVGETTHKINLDNFEIKIYYSKHFWCYSFVNYAGLSVTFDCTLYECKVITEKFQENKKSFPFYDIYMSWLMNKIPIHLKYI